MGRMAIACVGGIGADCMLTRAGESVHHHNELRYGSELAVLWTKRKATTGMRSTGSMHPAP